MNFRLTKAQLAHLSTVGMAIHGGQRPTVFDGGFVGSTQADESEVSSDGPQGKTHRSSAGSRQGRRASAGSRPQAARHNWRSDALEAAYGAGFRVLARHYEALAFQDKNGLWVVATSNPLGRNGPQVHFLIAFPLDQGIAPRAWAFEQIGANARLASLKHTNFPDASICAYVEGEGAWPNTDGLLGLVDIFSIWTIKKWHRERLGWWPGKQAGACALYRRREFDPHEHCGCPSGLRYGECHMAADLLVDEARAHADFRRLFACNYEDRAPPEAVVQAAKSNWTKMPAMASAFAYRFRDSEPLMEFQ